MEIIKIICIVSRWVNKDVISLSHSPCILSSFFSGPKPNSSTLCTLHWRERVPLHFNSYFLSSHWVFINLCQSSFTEPVKSYVPCNERCALWVLSQEHHPLYHGVVSGHSCGQDGAQSYWFQCPCYPGLLSESKKDERGNQERDSILFSSENQFVFVQCGSDDCWHMKRDLKASPHPLIKCNKGHKAGSLFSYHLTSFHWHSK